MTVALRAARVVEQAAAEWHAADRPEHYLWDDKRLTTTLTILEMDGDGGNLHPTTQPIVELDDEAREFLDATSHRVERERRRRTRVITVLSTLLVFALIAVGVVVWQQQRVSVAHNTIIARGMVAQADRIRDQDPRVALQLGVAASHFDPSPQTRASLQLARCWPRSSRMCGW